MNRAGGMNRPKTIKLSPSCSVRDGRYLSAGNVSQVTIKMIWSSITKAVTPRSEGAKPEYDFDCRTIVHEQVGAASGMCLEIETSRRSEPHECLARHSVNIELAESKK